MRAEPVGGSNKVGVKRIENNDGDGDRAVRRVGKECDFVRLCLGTVSHSIESD